MCRVPNTNQEYAVYYLMSFLSFWSANSPKLEMIIPTAFQYHDLKMTWKQKGTDPDQKLLLQTYNIEEIVQRKKWEIVSQE